VSEGREVGEWCVSPRLTVRPGARRCARSCANHVAPRHGRKEEVNGDERACASNGCGRSDGPEQESMLLKERKVALRAV